MFPANLSDTKPRGNLAHFIEYEHGLVLIDYWANFNDPEPSLLQAEQS